MSATEKEKPRKKKKFSEKSPLSLRKTTRISSSKISRKKSSTRQSSSKTSPGNVSEDVATPKKRLRNTLPEEDTPVTQPEKKKKKSHDKYCWVCHRDAINFRCQICPRAYHTRCVADHAEPVKDWTCGECDAIMKAENVDTCSLAIKIVSLDQLCNLLRFSLNRMKIQVAAEEFMKPVSADEVPTYPDYVCNPMDLGTLEKNIKGKVYGCTEAFLADSKWILHNSIVFNGYRHRLTSIAKTMVKVCKHEMDEIESCPDCYYNAYTKRDNWFLEPCRPLHLLIWAKLKGFPYWPAKAMKVTDGNVDVRFFGAHDRAWIPVSQCFLLSEVIPTPIKNKKKGGFEASMEELEQHLKRVKEKYGQFVYAPYRAKLSTDSITLNVREMVPAAELNPRKLAPKKKSDTGHQDSDVGKSDTSDHTETESRSKETLDEKSSPKKESTDDINLDNLIKIPDIESQGSPSGVFESTRALSPQMMSLDLQTAQMDLTKLTKPKHSENINKLKSTFEKIKESARLSESSDSSSRDSSSNRENASEGKMENFGEMCSSEIKSEMDSSVHETSMDAADTSNMASATVDESPAKDDSVLSSPKVRDMFAEKLSKTIASCKAKLGIEEVNEAEEGSEESEDELMSEVGNEELDDVRKVSEDEPSSRGSESENKVEDCEKPVVDFANILSAKDGEATLQKDASKEEEESSEPGFEMDRKSPGEPILEDKTDENENEKDAGNVSSQSNNENQDIEDEGFPGKLKTAMMEMHESESPDDSPDENELVIDLDRVDREAKQRRKKSANIGTKRSFGDIGKKRAKGKANKDQETASVAEERKHFSEQAGESDNLPPPKTKLRRLSSSDSRKSSSPHSLVQETPDLSSGSAETQPREELDRKSKKFPEKMSDFTRVDEISDEMVSENTESTIVALRLEIDRMRWHHKQQIIEMKHNSDLVLLEMRMSLEAMNMRSVANARKQFENDLQKAIDDTKKKQWCAKCKKEAIFYCCWNTSYCDYPCQQSHWPVHMKTCTQSQANSDGDNVTAEMGTREMDPNNGQNSYVKDNQRDLGNNAKDFDNTMSYSELMRLVDVPQYEEEMLQVGAPSYQFYAASQHMPSTSAHIQPTMARSPHSTYRMVRTTSPSSYFTPAYGSANDLPSQGQGMTYHPLQPPGIMSSNIRSTHHRTAVSYPMAMSRQPRSLVPQSSNAHGKRYSTRNIIEIRSLNNPPI